MTGCQSFLSSTLSQLSEEGSLSCQQDVWAQNHQNVFLPTSANGAAPKFYVTLKSPFNHSTSTLSRQVASMPTALTLMNFLLQLPLPRKFSQTTKSSPVFSGIKDVSTGFSFSKCFLHLPTYFSRQCQHFHASAKTHKATFCLCLLAHWIVFQSSIRNM